MYRLHFLFLFIFFSLIAHAQDEPNSFESYNKVGLRFGSLGIRMRDQAISRHLFQGNAVPVIGIVEYGTPKLRIGVINTFSTTLDLKAKTLDGFKYKGDYGYSIDDTINGIDHKTISAIYRGILINAIFKVHTSKSEMVRVFIGGAFNYQFLDKEFLTLNYTNLMTDKFSQVELMGSVEYIPGERHKFSYSLAIPVISSINRTLTLPYGEPELIVSKKWSTLNQMFALDSRLGYEFRMGRRWSLEANYNFNYLQCSFPRKEQLVLQSFTVGINYFF